MATSKQHTGLGRGLGSLIPENFDTATLLEQGERIQQLELTLLRPNSDQPRTIFDETALAELAASIKQHGIVQPLVVTNQKGTYLIIAGERRWRAAKIAGQKTVPVIVRSLKEQEQLEVALIENVQRVDLGSLEQAVTIERLHVQFNLSYSEIAKRLGKAETTVSNIVRLLGLPKPAQAALNEGQISEGHARQILALKGMPDKQAELLGLISSQKWNVRQAERFVTSVKSGLQAVKAVQSRMAAETPETKQLSKRYHTPIKIYRTAKGGRVEMQFTSDEELQRLLGELGR
ncbi:ParB/RepB/Spo0J family partition protein [Candidatus Saccharibacteria bacterium]|nr:MAG: ParB/RepB/Spo0J family partition protein [Candidatus Saccharibacteria bacterium]